MLCDIEWDAPIGKAAACGGIAMFRVSAFDHSGGFRIDLIAGEEPELCLRLRSSGWSIWRLDYDMALHDAAMYKFSQWWMRSVRGGFAAAQGAHLHGESPETYKVRETRSTWFWGFLLPLLILLLSYLLLPMAILLFLFYPFQIARIAFRGKRSTKENWWQALFLVLGKFPEMLGQMKFLVAHFSRRKQSLIEYK